MILKVFLTGWVILIVAVGLNIVANRFGIDTWYPFVEQIGKDGFTKAFMKASISSRLFLFVIYPALLGFAAFLSFKVLK